MDRVAVFIDAGYLFAAGSTLLAGHKLRRGETRLDEVAALAFFGGLARATGLPLLRIYWYDGTNAGPSPVHTSLAYRSDVKMRLGIVNSAGEQKGVDSLIVTDLINLSRNRAMADAVLLTGDEDIRVGVQQAQELGVRVHLVGIEPAQNNQSNLLRQEADTLHEITRAEIGTFLSQITPLPIVVAPLASTQVSVGLAAVPSTSIPTGAAPTLTSQFGTIATQVATAISKIDSDRVANDVTGSVPRDIDQQLLRAARIAKAASLEEHEKRELRRLFIQACKART